MIHEFENIRFFFGNASTPVDGKALIESYDQAIESRNQIASLASKLGVSDLFFLHQIHANYGHIITKKDKNSFKSFSIDGDYLITRCKNVAIGVVTADCAPVLIYDPIKSVVAAVHAGWKGAVSNVVANACKEMHEKCGSHYSDLQAWVGPCARVCCYEVGQDFKNNIPDDYIGNIIHRADKLYFDLVACVEKQLLNLGVCQEHINLSNADCTLHVDGYCSSRRSDRSPFRQLSVIFLK